MSSSHVAATGVLAPEHTQQLVGPILKDFFAEQITRAEMMGPEYTALWRAMDTLMSAGGKRLRPYLVILAYQAFSRDSIQTILPVAAAQELLHFALLIHDDIIDRDYVRYGMKNISGQFDDLYATYIKDADERRHFSDSAAILAGDLAISAAYQLITQAELTNQQTIAAQQIMGDSIFAVAGGELLDMESAFRPTGTVDTIKVALHKTASYSFVGPLLTGALLGDADEANSAALRIYGENLGIAYQLTDDLLGVFGDETKTGKSVSNDIREGKYTYLIEQCMAHKDASDRQILHDLFGKHSLSDDEADTFRTMLERCGARERTEAAVRQYREAALTALGELHIDDVTRQSFHELVRKSTERAR